MYIEYIFDPQLVDGLRLSAAIVAKTAATSHPHNMLNATLGQQQTAMQSEGEHSGINGTD
ncbi:hypothetical protein M5D96_002164, partial [Drosophila gunungcola]